MADTKPTKKPPGGTQYRFIGPHAVILDEGQPLGPGDYVTLDAPGEHAQGMIDIGWLIDATGVTPPEPQMEEQSTEEEAPA